jgi:molybdate transport system substrate-binding protein
MLLKEVSCMRRSPWMLTLALLLVILTACGGAQPAAPAATSAPAPTTPAPTAAPSTAAPAPTVAPEPTAAPTAENELTVFAAASLTEAFKAIGALFEEANAGTTLTFNFAGSDQLATQIAEGAPADVFASANRTQMNNVIKSGQVISGTERTFVRNRLTVVYPKDNPGGITTLQDLAKPGLKVVLAQKSVPVGTYALDFLGKASKLPEYTAEFSPSVLANVVSYEENVRAVLSKIALGEADAGIVYTTDAATVAAEVGQIAIPDELNTIATYPIAATTTAKNADLAKKFVDYVLGPEGQQVLVQYGFIPTIGSASGAAPAAAALAIGGLVDTPTSLTLEAFNKLEQVEVKATDKGGTEQTYKGVPIATLLEEAGVKSGATKVIFTGGDGYAAEVTLADLHSDKDAIITADENGAFHNIIPSQMPNVWVKGLVKLEVA